MATYSQIKPSFWTDPDVMDSPPEHKLIFLYLFTNKLCTVSGIYPISTKTISNETNYPVELIEESLTKIKNIFYDFRNKVVFIKNYMRHRTGGNPGLIIKGIKNDFALTYKSPIWHSFVKEYPNYEKVINNGNMQLPLETEIICKPTFQQPLDNLSTTVGQPLGNRSTVGQPLNNNNNNNILSIKSISSINKQYTLSKDKGDKSPQNNSFKYFINLLKESSDNSKKMGVLITAFKEWHNDTIESDFDNLGDRIASIVKYSNNDHGYVLKIMHDSITASISGSHCNYIQGIMRSKKQENKEISIKKSIKNDPDRFIKGKYGHMVNRIDLLSLKGNPKYQRGIK